MTVGRPVGSREISVSQLKKMVEMIKNDDKTYTRRELSEATGISIRQIDKYCVDWELRGLTQQGNQNVG